MHRNYLGSISEQERPPVEGASHSAARDGAALAPSGSHLARSPKEPLHNTMSVACVHGPYASRGLLGRVCVRLAGGRSKCRRAWANADCLAVCRYRVLMLKAMGDMRRATRLAIMGVVVSQYFLKCAVARCASKALASA